VHAVARVTDKNVDFFCDTTNMLRLVLLKLTSGVFRRNMKGTYHYITIKNHSQQDAMFLEFIYFYRRSTCFRLFIRPSSGTHNCTYSFRYCQPTLLLAAIVDEMESNSVG
jgi:hypothetical protein